MSLTIIEKDLRELQIRHRMRRVAFRRACRKREKNPMTVQFSHLTDLRCLIDETEDDIATFLKENQC